MKDKKVKKIFELSKSKKNDLERGFNWYSAVFLGFVISTIMFGIENINEFLFGKTNIAWIKFIEFLILLFLTLYIGNKVECRLSAIGLKNEKITSLTKAKKLLI